ncbi:hypothetical protein NEISICOT_00961 [Neisseria sicca ATCC 29256]|uniref:Uncharacterized protein n=1 Tax=Neisseria sicca ATCC 29256 TaxID=547045 RepID=C6M370_NEISI|nr:hypothetical protein NEISICOT_00961 [Neisseria sicca ATCC 29256]
MAHFYASNFVNKLFLQRSQWIKFKSGQGDEAADSTDSTEPIHLVLQHLRESFSLS